MKPTRFFLVIALLSTALIAGYPAYQANSNRAEVALQAAIKTELVNGDLNAAIEQYKKIIATRGTSRETVAKAMLRLGGCYEKLGLKEAQQIYTSLINDYSENKNEVSVARIRLASLERTLAQKDEKENVTESEGIRIKSIWKVPGTDYLGSVSPDGRFHAYIYWGEGDVAIRDLISGENKILTHDAGDSKGFAMTPRFSRNGEQIAYSWWNSGHTYDLFLIDVNNPSPRRLYRREGEHVDPIFWLSDEELIFSRYKFPTQKAEVCSLNISDGTIHELRKFDRRKWPRLSGSPDEKFIAYDFANETDNGNFDISLLLNKGESEIPLV